MAENMYIFHEKPVQSRNTTVVIVCWIIIITLVVLNVAAFSFAKNRLRMQRAFSSDGSRALAQVAKPTSTPTARVTAVPVTTGGISISFDQSEVQLGSIGDEIKFNVLANSGTDPVVGGSITVLYPAALQLNLEKTKNQETNADPMCTKLSQVLIVTGDKGIAKMGKVSLSENKNLPSGAFCFGTLFFTIVSNENEVQSNTISFGGNISDTRDWDFVGLNKGFDVKLGNPVRIVGSTDGIVTPFSCLKKSNGDANCDGQITDEDFTLYLVEYMAQNQGVLDVVKAKTDFNSDNTVDSKDFDILLKTLNIPAALVIPTISPTSNTSPTSK
jgi:hypothetical protein